MTTMPADTKSEERFHPAVSPASYSQFDLQTALDNFSLEILPQAVLARPPTPVEPEPWLTETLRRGQTLTLGSEKAKSEFIVAPVLLAVRDLISRPVSLHSGVRFDVDAARGLRGFCDFILSAGPQVPVIRLPVLTIVEVKEDSVDGGLGQCAAEMVAAALFNQRRSHVGSPVFGCVTNMDTWQFLRLKDNVLSLDPRKLSLEHLPEILGSFKAMAEESLSASGPAGSPGS